MNIFKSLSQGNGRISETNITSFLSYLLNSTNELNDAFVVLFFLFIDDNLPSNKILDLLAIRQGSLREKIVDFKRRFTVIAEPEYSINNRTQIVDVFLKITSRDQDVAYVLIENKIKKEASNAEQALKQYECFRKSAEHNPGLPVYSIILTTDSERFSGMYSNVIAVNERTAWLKWTNGKDANNSLEAILRKLIRSEHEAEIQPIDPNTQFIIKSFVDYILTEFSYKEYGQKNFSFNGFDVVSQANAEFDGRQYIIKRFENNMIRLFDENDNLQDVEVMPLLKAINEKYALGISPTFPGGQIKNTQYWGRDVINALNK